jgi:hypothetical protein
LLAAGLLVEWPEGAEAPNDHWLSSLPADTPIADLARLAKVRRRIEHDYRELKHGLGLDHFERPVLARLAPPRHPRHRRPRVSHRTAARLRSTHADRALYQTFDALQDVLGWWTGTCTTCHQPLPSRPHTTSRSRQT